MEKVYKSKYSITNKETYLIFGIPLFAFFLIGMAVLYPSGSLKDNTLGILFIIAIFGIIEFIGIYFSKITVILRDDGIKWKTICGTAYVRWDEIKKLERVYAGYAGFGDRIITKKRVLYVPPNIENYHEMFNEIKKYTKKGVKWGV